MKKALLLIFIIGTGIISLSLVIKQINLNLISGAPPYHVSEGEIPPPENLDEYAYLRDWKRPDVPPKIGLQVGHWRNEEIPEELHRLRGNTGAEGGGATEVEVNLAIAQATKELLEAQGISVDILPATVPPDYWADAFIAIHADGNLDPSKSGYKAATPRRDFTQNANDLLEIIERNYALTTGLPYDPNVTRNMRGYYAFSWWRFDHAVHPMTTSLILETGFLSSPSDRTIILDNPEISAEGLANGIIEYLRSKDLLS